MYMHICIYGVEHCYLTVLDSCAKQTFSMAANMLCSSEVIFLVSSPPEEKNVSCMVKASSLI